MSAAARMESCGGQGELLQVAPSAKHLLKRTKQAEQESVHEEEPSALAPRAAPTPCSGASLCKKRLFMLITPLAFSITVA